MNAPHPTPTPHEESIIALSRWLTTPAGQYVLEWEQAQLDMVVADIFGYNAVQVGLPQLPALRSNRMPYAYLAGQSYAEFEAGIECATDNGASCAPARVLARAEELPFATHSLDLLVLPHALEFATNPHQVLREVERVLIPEGQVVITGFNPASLWGARQVLGRAFDAPFLPQQGQFLGLSRLKDWLKLLGFQLQRGRFGCYRPPAKSAKGMARFGFMEKMGDRWWPICGAVYLVSAIKRVHGMHLIGPAWKEVKAAAPSLAPTAHRGTIDYRTTAQRHSEEELTPHG
jgi:SAM-dependent methyltransferase